MTAYFTEPLGDEFRKAIEEAFKEINEEGDSKKARKSKSKRSKARSNNGARKKPASKPRLQNS